MTIGGRGRCALSLSLFHKTSHHVSSSLHSLHAMTTLSIGYSEAICFKMKHIDLKLLLCISFSHCCMYPLSVRFVKYVSAAAPGSRWDVSMEYEIEIQDDDDDDDDEGEEGENGEDEE